jgi:hypothetical protein
MRKIGTDFAAAAAACRLIEASAATRAATPAAI